MNSYIFNFNNIKKIIVLEKKVKLWIFINVIIFLLVTALSSLYLNSIFPKKARNNFKTKAISELSEFTRIILIGASHFFSDIDPSMLSASSMTLSSGSLNYATQFAILKKNIKKTPNLKICVMELDRIPLTINTVDNRMNRFKGDFRDLHDLGLTYWDIPDLNPLVSFMLWVTKSKYFRLIFYGPKLNLELSINADNTKKNIKMNREVQSIVKPGFFAKDRTLLQYWEQKKRVRIKRKPSKYDKKNINSKALSQMIKFIEARGIRILFIRFPRYKPDTKGLNELILIARKASKYKVNVYDFEKDNRFNENHFSDPNHLNTQGAKVFTKILEKVINEFASKEQIRL